VVKTGIGLLKLQCLAVFTDQRSLDPKTERGTLGTGMYLTDTMTTPHVHAMYVHAVVT